MFPKLISLSTMCESILITYILVLQAVEENTLQRLNMPLNGGAGWR